MNTIFMQILIIILGLLMLSFPFVLAYDDIKPYIEEYKEFKENADARITYDVFLGMLWLEEETIKSIYEWKKCKLKFEDYGVILLTKHCGADGAYHYSDDKKYAFKTLKDFLKYRRYLKSEQARKNAEAKKIKIANEINELNNLKKLLEDSYEHK